MKKNGPCIMIWILLVPLFIEKGMYQNNNFSIYFYIKNLYSEFHIVCRSIKKKNKSQNRSEAVSIMEKNITSSEHENDDPVMNAIKNNNLEVKIYSFIS